MAASTCPTCGKGGEESKDEFYVGVYGPDGPARFGRKKGGILCSFKDVLRKMYAKTLYFSAVFCKIFLLEKPAELCFLRGRNWNEAFFFKKIVKTYYPNFQQRHAWQSWRRPSWFWRCVGGRFFFCSRTTTHLFVGHSIISRGNSHTPRKKSESRPSSAVASAASKHHEGRYDRPGPPGPRWSEVGHTASPYLFFYFFFQADVFFYTELIFLGNNKKERNFS